MRCLSLSSIPASTAAASKHSPPPAYLVLERQFRCSLTALPFKFKLKIKDPDENPTLTPIDYDNVPGFNPQKKRGMYEDEDNAAHVERNQNAIYKRNQQKKAAFHVDSKTRAEVVKSWPLVTMNLHALKGTDLPFGIKFSVAYHDTHAYERHSGPVVLILHGLQLPSVSFAPLIEPLVSKGYRVIAPIFPYVGHNIFKPNPKLVTTAKEMDLFSHSTMERGIFTHDFVKAVLGSEGKCDVLVCADIASYPAVWLGASNFTKGVVFLDPFPGKLLPIMKPLFLYTIMSKIWELYWHRFLSLPFMAFLMSTKGFGSISLKEASIHARIVAFTDFDSVEGGMTTMGMRGLPSIVYASKRNKFVGLNEAKDMMSRLGVEQRFIVDLDSAPSSSSTFTKSPSPPPSQTSSPSASSQTTTSPTEESPAFSGTSQTNSVNQSVYDRTLPEVGEQRQKQQQSLGRIFEPNKQDAFAEYNRRFAKSDWYHLAHPIANDIDRMIRGFYPK